MIELLFIVVVIVDVDVDDDDDERGAWGARKRPSIDENKREVIIGDDWGEYSSIGPFKGDRRKLFSSNVFISWRNVFWICCCCWEENCSIVVDVDVEGGIDWWWNVLNEVEECFNW